MAWFTSMKLLAIWVFLMCLPLFGVTLPAMMVLLVGVIGVIAAVGILTGWF
jgi:hypothetical protein